jgi:sulfur carrier protein ThiS
LKITVESLGLPALADVIGRKAEIQLEGGTLADLVAHLAGRFGARARRLLLDDEGHLDRTIQVLLNDREFVGREELADRKLSEGDGVKFMLLVCGG